MAEPGSGRKSLAGSAFSCGRHVSWVTPAVGGWLRSPPGYSTVLVSWGTVAELLMAPFTMSARSRAPRILAPAKYCDGSNVPARTRLAGPPIGPKVRDKLFTAMLGVASPPERSLDANVSGVGTAGIDANKRDGLPAPNPF